ncbi:MAG: hypothetical protein ACP5QG_07210 [candidate division WOR-3 bacterium]
MLPSRVVNLGGDIRLLSVGTAGAEFLLVSATGFVVQTSRVPANGEFRISLQGIRPSVYTLVWSGARRVILFAS